MKISAELIIGVVLTIISAYYWGEIGASRPVHEVPILFRYTFRLAPFLDIVLTAGSMLLFYRGLLKLRK